MIHNPYLEKGETHIFTYSEKKWPKYLCVNLDIDENSWLHKNTDGFDLFAFITKDNKLITQKHLVFYNNLMDPDSIIQNISDSRDNINDSLLSFDEVLLINIENLAIGQSIEIYCQFIGKPILKNKSFLNKLFFNKNKNKSETTLGEISFCFLDHNFNDWGWPSYGKGHELNLSIQLLELHKISQDSCQITCIVEARESSIDKIIEKYLT